MDAPPFRASGANIGTAGGTPRSYIPSSDDTFIPNISALVAEISHSLDFVQISKLKFTSYRK
ncbi:uncharacterized protein J3R85_004238 [Psidium guajava]|nr:uncharacterized protein J3R85_004238 [Psidium guajava]